MNNVTMKRRLLNESKQWSENFVHKNKILCLKKDGDNLIGAHLYFTSLGNMKDVFFEIIVDYEYPFSPPKVFYLPNHREWKKSVLQMYRLSHYGRKEMECISEYVGCLCCHSLICRDNWHPTKNIMNLADEVEIIMLLRQRICDRILFKMMYNKLELPSDLFKNILEYI
jgi:hypothetical protein